MTSSDKRLNPLGGIPLERGRVTLLTIKHDAWCPTVNGGTADDCTCEPEFVVTMLPRPGKPEG